MKKRQLPLLLAAAWLAATWLPESLNAQAVRHDVIVEVATGNWCYYCPGAAKGVDDLASSGANVGIVEHHNGDAYTTSFTDNRNIYFNVQGFPTAFFDGQNEVIGGDHVISMYPTYRMKYEAAAAVATPIDISASWVQNGSNVDVTVSVTQVGAYTGNTLRIQSVLTESHIAANWQGMTHCDFVNRAMYPDENGIAITTTQGGPAVTQTFSMAIQPGWVQQNMELLVWVEDSDTKEILNGKMLPLSTAANAVDAELVGIQNIVPHQSCATSFAPKLMLHNMGSSPLSSATFTYDVNGGTPATFQWTGNIAYYDYDTVTLPAISFSPQSINDFHISMVVTGDASTGNDMDTVSWEGASTHNFGEFWLRIKPDIYGSEITWDLRDGNGAVLYSGGPYFDGNRIQINLPLYLGPNDCYHLGMYDEFGDGIAANSPFGWYQIEAPNGDTIFRGGEYGAADYVDFITDGIASNTPRLDDQVSLFPNPNQGRFELQFAHPLTSVAQVAIWSMDGREIWRGQVSAQSSEIELKDVAPGMYLLRAMLPEGVAIHKLEVR
ncbi:MAG: Omp28-related outer membrane protein [Bacteroidia bacterium]